ncbi:type IV pilin protein [Marinobacter salexigens]|uniref:type IV pilin protein n=1 Tax=Marinobacter salexigens TaxID=1925763 RepID=UPI000C28CA27|tara:strand:- start:80 stop:448 length:369 start_codon:yes stop_codon:yes gene_type:complete
MIVVAIIGILAAIAYPSYQNHIEKTRRSVAQADLMELAQWMERRYTASYDYRDGSGAPTPPFQKSPQDGSATFYKLSFVKDSVTKDSFTLQAVPEGAQANDDCGTLTLDSSGTKGAAKSGCW